MQCPTCHFASATCPVNHPKLTVWSLDPPDGLGAELTAKPWQFVASSDQLLLSVYVVLPTRVR